MRLQKGFTLIELIIVFSIMALLGIIGVASLSSYNATQEVTTTALNLKSLLTQAESETLSQVKPSACPTNLSNPNLNSNLDGYEVDFCAGSLIGRPSACKASNDYEINALCDNGVGYTETESKTYPINISISSTSRSYFFPVLTAGVSKAGVVTVSAYGKTQTISISSLGVIQ